VKERAAASNPIARWGKEIRWGSQLTLGKKTEGYCPVREKKTSFSIKEKGESDLKGFLRKKEKGLVGRRKADLGILMDGPRECMGGGFCAKKGEGGGGDLPRVGEERLKILPLKVIILVVKGNLRERELNGLC